MITEEILEKCQPIIGEFMEEHKIPELYWTVVEDLFCLDDDQIADFVREMQYAKVAEYGVSKDDIKAWKAKYWKEG